LISFSFLRRELQKLGRSRKPPSRTHALTREIYEPEHRKDQLQAAVYFLTARVGELAVELAVVSVMSIGE
jgi:hypothetical protein